MGRRRRHPAPGWPGTADGRRRAVLEELVSEAERKALAGMAPAEERRYLQRL